MWSVRATVAPNDLVLLWLTRDDIHPVTVDPAKTFNSKYGVFPHTAFLGVPYGSKIPAKDARGFLHLLRPTPELWSRALPHRTQILYLADIAFITARLNIVPGACVVEAGTGSGSFSHSVARTIGTTGHLFSYEFHEIRVAKAREEFARHGLKSIITLTHRNVCKDGFTIIDTADSVFLDLPAPWEAIHHAKHALRKDRITRICCFSPCIEQVLRTVSALNDAGFAEVTMYETLLRPLDVASVPVLTSVADVSAKLKDLERKREDKRLKQIAAAAASRDQSKRKRDSDDPEPSSTSPKRPRMDDEKDEDGAPPVVAVVDPSSSAAQTEEKTSVSKVFPEVRGHTSYLTFAVLLPAVQS